MVILGLGLLQNDLNSYTPQMYFHNSAQWADPGLHEILLLALVLLGLWTWLGLGQGGFGLGLDNNNSRSVPMLSHFYNNKIEGDSVFMKHLRENMTGCWLIVEMRDIGQVF